MWQKIKKNEFEKYSSLLQFLSTDCQWDWAYFQMFNGLLISSFMVQFSSIQSLSRVWLFVTPWIAACQAYLSITNSRSLLKLMSIELVMPSNHLMKEDSDKVGLKLNIQKTKIMASSPITSWHIDGETMEAQAGFTQLSRQSSRSWAGRNHAA